MDSAVQPQIQNRGYREETDDDLITRCRLGDTNAFGELASRYQVLAFRAAFFLLRDEEEARDQVQNAFCKAFEHLSQFRRDAKFSTWLMRIVVNQCLMQLRRARRGKVVSVDSLSPRTDTVTLELRDHGRSAEAELQSAETTRILRREISRIPPLLRNVFLLREIQQRSMPAVAEELGISVNAAKSRLLRARVELRNRLQRELYA
ncbi:MAG: sigma-70 family RNA polymerase sigma factor [Bryobacteraceae bacterium]